MRTKGSVRFAPYYKLEVWSADLAVWRPVKHTHATIEWARNATPAGRPWRLYRVEEASG